MEPVPDAPESLARSADLTRVNDYDDFAEAYSAENEIDPLRLRPHPYEFALYYDV